jgi:Na+/H+ antiporter NhaD/arsenite permease-like protein
MLTATLTLAVFGLTLALIFLRPRGLNEAWATVIGGCFMLVLGLETPAHRTACRSRERWRTPAR